MNRITEEDNKKFYEMWKDFKKTEFWRKEGRFYFHSKKNTEYTLVPIFFTILCFLFGKPLFSIAFWIGYWAWCKQNDFELKKDPYYQMKQKECSDYVLLQWAKWYDKKYGLESKDEVKKIDEQNEKNDKLYDKDLDILKVLKR